MVDNVGICKEWNTLIDLDSNMPLACLIRGAGSVLCDVCRKKYLEQAKKVEKDIKEVGGTWRVVKIGRAK